jgi:caffeoyl-CoA O-methyltransferase
MGHKGTVDAIEHEPETVKVMKDVLKDAQLVRRVRIHLGEALQILKGLKGPFDVVFLDADKDDYPNYLDHAIRMTRKGSIILAHNMLWGGSVMQGHRREGAEGIIEYTRRIFQDPRFSSLIVSVGDGLAISYRVA